MSYEERDNGTHAVMCDVQGCSHELPAPSKEDAFGDANLAGWIESGKDAAGDVLHSCRDCYEGTNPMQTALQQAMGTATPHVMAPAQVRAGDPVISNDGTQVGTYAEDGNQGEAVPVNIDLPDPPKPGQNASAAYAAMMEGTDEDDDAHPPAYRSAVAPAGHPMAEASADDDGDPEGSGGDLRDADTGTGGDGSQETADTEGRAGGFHIELDNSDDPFEGLGWDPYSDE